MHLHNAASKWATLRRMMLILGGRSTLAVVVLTVLVACGRSKPSGSDYLGNWGGTVESITGDEGPCHLSISSVGQSFVIKSERQTIGNCAAYEGIWTLTPEGNLKGGPMGSMLISYDNTTKQAVVSGLGKLRYLTKAPSGEEVRDAAQSKDYWIDREGLTWTTKDNGHGEINWNAATAYCAELPLGGWQDWRLPSIDELERVYDPSMPKNGSSAPAIRSPLHLSKGTRDLPVGGQWVWSGTTFEGSNGGPTKRYARTFNFGYGSRDTIAVDDSKYADARVLCVRP
jgi:hypothetical protein